MHAGGKREVVFAELEVATTGILLSETAGGRRVGGGKHDDARLFLSAVDDRVNLMVIVDSSKFKLIVQPVKKTDKNEAELTTYSLSKGMLPEL